MLHVLVVAEQLRFHLGRADGRRHDSALRAEHDKQVGQCRAEVASIVARGPRAVAAREVLVEELGDRPFVDPVQPQASAACPACEMRDAGQVGSAGGYGVPALREVPLECMHVRADRPVGDPVDANAAGTVNDAHGGLQKWAHQCT